MQIIALIMETAESPIQRRDLESRSAPCALFGFPKDRVTVS